MKKNIAGFTLVELAIVMIIIGVLLGGAITAAKPIMQKIQYSSTEKSITTVRHALSAYAVRHNRLPCPASPNPGTEPFGAERGSGVNGTDYGTCTGDDVVGIIPFRTLGLSEDTVRDGWDRYITYRVSPAFAINPADITKDAQNNIHEKCRTEDWIEVGEGAGKGYSLDPKKEDFADKPYVYKHSFGDGNELSIRDVGSNALHWADVPKKYHQDKGKSCEEVECYRGIGIYRPDNAYHGKIYQDRVSLEYKDPVEDVHYVLDDVANNIDEGKSILFQIYYGSGVNDYVWYELQLEYGETPSGQLSPEAYSTKGMPIYRQKLNEDVLDTETDLVTLAVNSSVLPEVDGIKQMVLYTNSAWAKAKGFVDDPDRPYRPSSLLISNIKSGNLSGGGDQNINPAKARFCCPLSSGNYDSSNDLRVLDTTNGDSLVQTNRTSTVTDYDDKDTKATGTIDYTSATAVAYALISHGPNGHGSFLANGTNNTYTAANFGTDEVENVGSIDPDDQTVVYREIDQSGDNTYFDDVVVWRTQDQVYSEFSTDSCLKP